MGHTARKLAGRALGAGAALVLTVALAPVAAQAANATFASASGSPFAVGDGPRAAAVGDFNNDDIPDLATANNNSNDVSIALGNGTGGFAASTTSTHAVGINPVSVAIGDFNNDDNPDLATANFGSRDVSILLGDGTGGFAASTISTQAANAILTSVAVGDFNNDDNPDLAIADLFYGNVSVLLGDGTGDFTAPATPTQAVGTGPTSVAVGDFNNDDKPDLATADSAAENVSILLGDGTGDFTSSPGHAAGNNPVSVVVGDFNNDDIPDLATADYLSDDVSILLGDGTGGFTAPTTSTHAVGDGPVSVAIGDFNNDDNPDLATANSLSDDVSLLLGDGTGDFTAPTTSTRAVGSLPDSVAIGDFNNDDRPDLAAANFGSDSVSILLNTTPAPVVPNGSPPGQPSGQRAAPRDTIAPAIAGAKLSATTFAVDNGAKASAAKAPKRGAKLTVRVSEPATVIFVTEQREGRRWRKVRIFGKRLPAGRSTINYSGKIKPRGKQRALKPGRYRLRMRPSDRAGNKGAVTTLSFRIVRR